MYKIFGKRLFDLIGSIILILLCTPMYFFISIILLFDVGWPLVFRQERLGYKAKPFGLWKFKSLNGDVISNRLWEPTDETERASWFGRFIRSHCLDELPQFVNVLVGDMSLVGPRPQQQINYSFEDITSEYVYKILCVRPGITGINQVTNNKNESRRITNTHRINNLRYVQKMSFWGDIQIISKTVLVMFKGR